MFCSLRMVGVLLLMSTMFLVGGQIWLLTPSVPSINVGACHDSSPSSTPGPPQPGTNHECCLTGHNHAVPVAPVQITHSMIEVESINPISIQPPTFFLAFSAEAENDTGPPQDYSLLRV